MLGHYKKSMNKWIKLNNAFAVDLNKSECVERKFIYVEGQCFSIKSYKVKHLYFVKDVVPYGEDYVDALIYYVMLK